MGGLFSKPYCSPERIPQGIFKIDDRRNAHEKALLAVGANRVSGVIVFLVYRFVWVAYHFLLGPRAIGGDIHISFLVLECVLEPVYFAVLPSQIFDQVTRIEVFARHVSNQFPWKEAASLGMNLFP